MFCYIRWVLLCSYIAPSRGPSPLSRIRRRRHMAIAFPKDPSQAHSILLAPQTSPFRCWATPFPPRLASQQLLVIMKAFHHHKPCAAAENRHHKM